MLKLRLQEIGSSLSSGTDASQVPDLPAEEQPGWHDSTLDLERGLDVVELSHDALMAVLQVPKPIPDQR